MAVFQDFDIESIDGRPNLLAQTRDKVVLAVNVASECGFTPQYDGLQALAEELADQPFVVVGFPCKSSRGRSTFKLSPVSSMSNSFARARRNG